MNDSQTHKPKKKKKKEKLELLKKVGMKRKRNQRKKKVIGDGEKEEEEEDKDRISSLPDSILHEILSSMDDLASAIQTCVLSKRWRYVWTSLPNLRFDFDQLDEVRMSRFKRFVNQVLSLRDNNSNVYRFYFSSGYLVDPCLFKKCISYAVRHNVQQLHLNAFELKLANCGNNSMLLDKPLRFPALKTLHLNRFGHDSANFITQTVGNCPNLETLILDCLYLNCFNITAPKLRKLELCYAEDSLGLYYESQIVISAPRLTSFKFEGYASPVFSPASFLCLDHVYVDVIPMFYRFQLASIVKERMPLNVINMLGQLQEAKSITLSPSTLEVLAMDPDSLRSHPSPFHKLKHLQLTQGGSSSSLSLPLNVINYLSQGLSCGGTLVMNFFPRCKWKAFTMKNAFIMKNESIFQNPSSLAPNGTLELLLKRLKQMLELNSAYTEPDRWLQGKWRLLDFIFANGG
ncbi:unnamed protein product [Camellia sinensis]